MAKLTPYEFDAPAHFASALINGDCTSFDDEAQAEFDAWVESNPDEARDVVGCAEESFIGRFNGLMCDMLTYTALSRED